jgi:hypothetical protein
MADRVFYVGAQTRPAAPASAQNILKLSKIGNGEVHENSPRHGKNWLSPGLHRKICGSPRPMLRWMLPMRLLKYLLVAVAFISWAVAQLLAFVPPVWNEWSGSVFDGCLLTVLLFVLWALIRRRWSTFAILCFPLVVIFLSAYGGRQPGDWLRAAGFRIHASPTEQYLSRCRLAAFIEDGKVQQVGECEGIQTSSITWNCVIYDTTGQIVLPRAQRTREWKSAVGLLSSPDVYIETEGRASHLFGDFYVIGVRIDELQGG